MANLSRRDVIIGCVVGFIAWLWAVHFLPSLRFVPHAFLIGTLSTVGVAAYIVLTTTQDPTSALGSVPPDTSFLGLTRNEQWHPEVSKLAKRNVYTPDRIHASSRRISRRLDNFLDLILRDFVKTWYTKISSGDTFVNEIERAIRAAIGKILNSVLQLDLVEFGVTRLLPIIHRHVERYAEAERLVRGKRNNVDSMNAQEYEITIAQRYRDGKLHPAATLSPTKALAQQQQHLRRLIGRILSVVMPFNMQSSAAVLTLVKEIVACAVLLPVLSLTADPDMLNQLIETYGRSILHERRTVRKFRAALDEQGSPAPQASFLPRLRRGDGERSFEAFSKSIKVCNSLSDAKSIEEEIVKQVKREEASSKRDATYLRRLEIGRKLLEQRIKELTNEAGATRPGLSNFALRDLLYDASGLAYFMEWMFELNTITLVQFWIVADGFRNNSTKSVRAPGKQQPAWVQSDRDLLVQISGRYLWKTELQVPQSTQDTVNVFLNNGDAASPQQYSRARLAVLELQDSVYAKMEKELLSKFKASELFRRWAGVPENKEARPEVNGRFVPGSQADGPPMPAKVEQLKQPELRRAIASHSDIANAVRKDALATAEPRRSLDESRDRQPLFDDEPADDPLARSTLSLDSTDDEDDKWKSPDQRNIMRAAQAALDDAMDQDANDEESFEAWESESLELAEESPRPPIDDEIPSASMSINGDGNGKPSLSSLGLVGTPSRRTVFSNGDLFGETEKTLLEDDEANDTDATNKTDEDDNIHEAAPGDLGLSELVQSLTLQIEKLEAQQKVVDSLVEKAELTNNGAELRILKKSKASLEREIHRKELQRQQYIVQKSENDLYGRADVGIKSIMVGKEPDGREFALYVIEVTRHGSEKAPPVTWAITRRYSEFHNLHRRLRKRYPSVKDLEFPRRQVVLTLQKDFLKKRSTALQKYLRELLVRPQVCRSIECRAFLSQQTIRPVSGNGQTLDRQDFITRIYSSVTDGMEEFIGNVPVLDQLSAAGQSIITAASTYASQPPPSSSTAFPTTPSRSPMSTTKSDFDSPRATAEAQAEISAFENRTDPETVTFIKPICDIFLELFQLNQGNNWLRGRAVVVVTQQLLGGTIERKVRETFRAYTTEGSICRYLDMARDLMWPNGVFRQKPPDRTAEEKETSQKNAAVVLQTLLPDLAGGVVGRGNAVAAAKRVGAMCNNEVLNRHLVYCLLDEVVEGVLGVRVTPR